jgi:hypothetical protein
VLAKESLKATEELYEEVKAIAEYCEADYESERGRLVIKPPPFPIRIETDLAPRVIQTYESHQNSSHRLQRNSYIAGIITLLVLAIYTVFTYKLWRVSRDSLESVQRAFVFCTPVGITPSWVTDKVGSTKIIGWTFFVPKKNAGTTPAKNLREHVAVSYSPQTITEAFNFHDFEGGVSGLANPQETTYYQTESIPVDVVEQAETGLQHLYVYGWITYNDVFRATRRRVTKFCFEVHPLSGDFRSTTGGPFGTRANFCTLGPKTLHNCSDEDCKG